MMIALLFILLAIISLYILFRIRVKKLKVYKTPLLGSVEVFEKYNKEKILTFKGVHQGISIDDKSIKKSYWYEMAKQAASHCQGKNSCHILMLGLGANTTTRLLAKMDPKVYQTIVEFDEKVIRVCQEFFHLSDIPNLTLIKADVYKLPKEKFKNSFDVILVDVFTNPKSFINSKSHSSEYVNTLKSWLKKDGIIIFNRQAHTPETLADIDKFKSRLKDLFADIKTVYVDDPRGYKNQIVTVFKD